VEVCSLISIAFIVVLAVVKSKVDFLKNSAQFFAICSLKHTTNSLSIELAAALKQLGTSGGGGGGGSVTAGGSGDVSSDELEDLQTKLKEQVPIDGSELQCGDRLSIE
jgi:hypothetical protein